MLAGDMSDSCMHCGKELPPDHAGPCPSCGRMGKAMQAGVEDGVKFRAAPIRRVLVLADFSMIRDLAALLEQQIERQETWLERRVNLLTENKTPEEQNAILQQFLGPHTLLAERYPNMLRQWAFTAAYASFEHRLNELCDSLQTEAGLRVAVTDLRGRGIKRARDYIKKVLAQPFPDREHAWSEMLVMQWIRNVIVHADGRIEYADCTDAQRRFIGDNLGLLYLADGGLVLQPGFVSRFIDLCHSLYEEIETSF